MPPSARCSRWCSATIPSTPLLTRFEKSPPPCSHAGPRTAVETLLLDARPGVSAGIVVCPISNLSTADRATEDHRRVVLDEPLGRAASTPARVGIPSTAHWHIVVDLGGHAGRINASVSVARLSSTCIQPVRSWVQGSGQHGATYTFRLALQSSIRRRTSYAVAGRTKRRRASRAPARSG